MDDKALRRDNDSPRRREARYRCDKSRYSIRFKDKLMDAAVQSDPVRGIAKVLEHIGGFVTDVVCDEPLMAVSQHNPPNVEALKLLLPWCSLRTHHRLFQQGLKRRQAQVVLTMLEHPGPSIKLGDYDPDDHTQEYAGGRAQAPPGKQEERLLRARPHLKQQAKANGRSKRQFAPGQIEMLRKRRREDHDLVGVRLLLRTLPEAMGGSSTALSDALAVAVEHNNARLAAVVLALMFDPEVVVDNIQRNPFVRRGRVHWCLGPLHKAKQRAVEIAQRQGWTQKRAKYQAAADKYARVVEEHKARLWQAKAELKLLRRKEKDYLSHLGEYRAAVERLRQRELREQSSSYSPGHTKSVESSHAPTAQVMEGLPSWLHRREAVAHELGQRTAAGTSRAHQQSTVRAARHNSHPSSSESLLGPSAAANASAEVEVAASVSAGAVPSLLSGFVGQRPAVSVSAGVDASASAGVAASVSAGPGPSLFSDFVGQRAAAPRDKAQVDAFFNASWEASRLTVFVGESSAGLEPGAGAIVIRQASRSSAGSSDSTKHHAAAGGLTDDERDYLKRNLWEQSRIKLRERLCFPTSKDENEYPLRVLLKAHPEWAAWGEDQPDFDGMFLLHVVCKFRAAVFPLSADFLRVAIDAFPEAASKVEGKCQMLPLHLLCFHSSYVAEEPTAVLLDANLGAVRHHDTGDNLPLHRVFVNRTKGLRVDVGAVRTLVKVFPEAASYARSFDQSTPLHLLCRCELLASHQHEIVVEMIWLLRTATVLDPALIKDHAGRVPGDYAQACAAPVHPTVIDALVHPLLHESILEEDVPPPLSEKGVSSGMSLPNDIAALRAELADLERKILAAGGPQPTLAEVQEEARHLEYELAWIKQKWATSENHRFKLQEHANGLAPVLALIQQYIDQHAPYNTTSAELPAHAQAQRTRVEACLTQGAAAPIFSDWVAEMETRQDHANELRGPLVNAAWCFSPVRDERQSDLPQELDQETMDLLGIREYDRSFHADAAAHPILHPPEHGDPLRWAHPGERTMNQHLDRGRDFHKNMGAAFTRPATAPAAAITPAPATPKQQANQHEAAKPTRAEGKGTKTKAETKGQRRQERAMRRARRNSVDQAALNHHHHARSMQSPVLAKDVSMGRIRRVSSNVHAGKQAVDAGAASSGGGGGK